jgi:NADH:ubiquinone oxidoreductase subunit 6 (subunit J)
MNARSQRWCIWSGLALLVFFGAGFLTAGFIPPPAPGQSAEQVARTYLDDQGRIRAGMVIVLVGAAFLLPWVAVISLQLQRIERRWGPMSLVQLAAGALGIVIFLFPAVMWLVAAYRPADRSAQTLQLLNDIGWLTFVGVASLVMIQNAAIGLAILQDRGEHPVFPRWAGYYNIWTVPLLAPGFLVFCFAAGPLAWNGIFTFWIPLVVFSAWFVVMIVVLRRAVDSDEAAAAASPGALTRG